MKLVNVGSRGRKAQRKLHLRQKYTTTGVPIAEESVFLCFLDEHASNISRLVNLEDCRLYGMKNHDCHIFIQTLIPLAYHDLLSKGI